MIRFISYILTLCLIFTGGYLVGAEITTAKAFTDAQTEYQALLQADRDYYTNICNAGIAEPMTTQEVLQALEWMQWCHQRWVDNPQWYNCDTPRQDKEKKIVITYGRILEWAIDKGVDKNDNGILPTSED